MSEPTREQCWDEFWDVVARGLAEANITLEEPIAVRRGLSGNGQDSQSSV